MQVEAALARYPGAVTSRHGDCAALNTEILGLVRSEAKTVSCVAVAGFAARGEALPEAGRVDIALDRDDVPQLAVRKVEVSRMLFGFGSRFACLTHS